MEEEIPVSPFERRVKYRSSCRGWLILCLCLSLAACNRSGSGTADPAPTEGQATTADSSTPPARPQTSTTAKVASATPKKGDAKERRFVGDIPLDVWFDDPLVIARNNTPLNGQLAPPVSNPPPTKSTDSAPSGTAPPKTTDTPAVPASGSTPSAAASGDWKSLISGDQIADETKAIRAQINSSLTTVSKYNGNYKEIQVEAATLAALAGIAAVHPDAIGWKKDAPFVRDLAVDVGKQAKGLAQPNFDNTRRSYDRLDGLLSGNRPADLGKAEPKLPFHEVASRGPLMRRMARAFENLRSNINTEAALKSSTDKVIHEATVLAVLSKVVATDGYTDSDQADYQKFLRELIEASRQASTAAKDGDFAAFTQAMSKSKKACDMCHQNFRFSDG